MSPDRNYITTEELGRLCHEAEVAEDALEVAQFERDIARGEYQLAIKRYRKQISPPS